MTGAGTQTDPYLISSSSDFYNYCFKARNYTKKYYKLTNNIDITSLTSTGTSDFSNVCLDGDGYILKAKLTQENLVEIVNGVSYYSCTLFDYFRSSELNNINIDLTIDLDLDTVEDLTSTSRLSNYCGLICFSELYSSDSERSIIKNSSVTINYVFKEYKEGNTVKFRTALYGLFYKGDGLTVEDLVLNVNAKSYSDNFGMVNGAINYNDLNIKGMNYVYYNFNAFNTSAVTYVYTSWFNHNDVKTNSELTIADIFHGTEHDYYAMNIENKNFKLTGTFQTLDLSINNTDNMNGSFKCNIKAEKVRNLDFIRDNFITNINDSNEIDIYTDEVEQLSIKATKKLADYINIHDGKFKNIYYVGGLTEGDEETLVYLNPLNVTYEDTIITNDYDKKYKPTYTAEIWQERYNDLHFKDMSDDYIDFIDLYTGNEWLKIPLYETGDVQFYITETEYKFMRFEENADIINDKGLKIFLTDGSYAEGRIIRTLPNNERI